MEASVLGIGLLGPGLDGWEASRPILSGAQPWMRRPVVLPTPAILPATERRRAGAVIRLALAVAGEAVAASGLDPAALRSVFATSNGDGPTVGTVLDAITRPDGFVSPTLFHNSVHNAAAGYWSIGVGSQRPATSIGCHDGTFAAAVMKAMAECCVEREPVLLVVYDVPFPTPLDAVRPMGDAFGVALVLAPDGPGPRIAADWRSTPAADTSPRLDSLAANPAAHSLALLESLARGGGSVALALLDGHLAISLRA
jgi:hypothetical protein